MTLPKARAEASRAFKEARQTVLVGSVSARTASERLITVFWNIRRQLGDMHSRDLFSRWFNKKHVALGKELSRLGLVGGGMVEVGHFKASLSKTAKMVMVSK